MLPVFNVMRGEVVGCYNHNDRAPERQMSFNQKHPLPYVIERSKLCAPLTGMLLKQRS